ncbi:RBBP9/YdeN family alpha/beta hydrolase [Cytophaga aurantiaca]|uniref:RBBP9/YdeN family alpha/beta hydrolase n=1 Tax=Cytophaga aurantiaca TaxID=29530 RepID=UPI001FDEF505|nr:alpha/beta fold hydrolase [Cytophaga aurantiaca]
MKSINLTEGKSSCTMLDNRFNYINVPGLGGSGESHWQTYWEKAYPEIIRVEQKDWDHPVRSIWVDQLIETIAQSGGKPVVLIGHSLGCATIVHAAKANALQGVSGAFLVAMPDVERADFPKECIGFSPMPRIELPFTSVMIASENDPYISSAELKKWADILGADFISVGEREHIGTAAKLEYWEEGQGLFEEFLKRI